MKVVTNPEGAINIDVDEVGCVIWGKVHNLKARTMIFDSVIHPDAQAEIDAICQKGDVLKVSKLVAVLRGILRYGLPNHEPVIYVTPGGVDLFKRSVAGLDAVFKIARPPSPMAKPQLHVLSVAPNANGSGLGAALASAIPRA
ncbi:hypothetical protein [Burkholderia anthina]|uniref:hypothetical protein n=1 Tax=Burkholderia anthina TaxID=179879 RepID=UPI00158974E1|nr:hypothetical protein [Burkholderia anthina]